MTVSLQGMSREEKLALLARLRAGDAAAPPEADEPRRFPLSFAQRRLWFLDRLEPGSSSEVIFRAVRVRGPLDPAALAGAVDRLVVRHGSLRTRFETAGDEPVQVMEPAARTEPVLVRTDLAGLAEDDREAALARLAREEAERPFDLTVAPLLRVRLVRLADHRHALLVAVHHIVADGWSLGLFFGELSKLYGAALDGREPSLPPPGAVYGELAADQRRRLDGEGLGRQLEAWRRQLDGAPQVLDLPTDRPRPALASFRGATVPAALSAEASEAVEALARAERGTPFMVLLAAFAVVLGRWGRQRDLLVGVPIAGRDDARSERVIGLFANTLVIRADLDGALDGDDAGPATFRALVRRVRRRTLDALARQETPFEHLVEELVTGRDLSRNPLFQAMFALQTMPPVTLALGPAEIEPLAVERSLAKVDLTLDLARREGAFRGVLEHNTDLFDRATAERLAAQVTRLAGELAADPDRPLDAFDLVGPEERCELLRLAAGPQLQVSEADTVDALFRRRAARAPDHPAVEVGGETWTYGALRRAARRVAEELAGRGLGPEERVGVLASRSPEAIAAFLGVLEAGGAYVPLDPEYPAERLAFMLDDSGARLLLAGAGGPALPGSEGAEVVPLSRDVLSAPGEVPGPEPLRQSPPEAAAYVLYTSGTTGRPKGVVVPHRALAGHCHGILTAYELAADDRVYQFAALSFDIAGEEIYPSLAAGATLHLRPEGVTPAPAELARRIAEEAISVVNVPTPLWHEWAGEVAVGRALPAPSLRLVVVGTEGALPERLATWRESLAGLDRPPRWVNAYGPTEATITATVWSPGPDASDTPQNLHRVPIGRPVAGVRALVLDPAGRLAGLGVPGELHLGGSNLARGYLGRPAATARAFVPDATSDAPGARLYATGDLVRLRPDGQIEFLGRTDDQIKVRGFRIEPGEVEATLVRHPAVRDVAVVPVEAGPGDTRLAAYVAGERGQEPAADELAAFLAERLPAYMVPAAFVRLAELPLTPAGKVDRRALPAPDWSTAGRDRHQAPRGPVEELVASVWGEVLDVDRVGARDDFFRLGGHSLLAARVVGRLRDRLGVDVPLRRLFEAPTVEGLARVVTELRRGGAPPLPPIARRSDDTPVPASFAQQRLWFLDRLDPGSPLYNMPALVALVPPDGESLDPAVLARALAEIVRRHEALRTTFERRPEGPLQVVGPVAVALPVVDLRALPAEAARRAARRAALAEARAPFDLARGPLVRWRLVRLPEGVERLLFTAHHTVSDGGSTDVFLSELATLYDTFAAGEPSSLAELPVQYGDFTLWQRETLDEETVGFLVEHWHEALAGAPRLLELPIDRPRPAAPSGAGLRVPFALPAGTTGALLALGRRAGATPFMVLLAAWATVLARWSRADTVPVGTPIAGRMRPELAPMIGFFANTLVLPAELGGDPAFVAVVERVRAVALGAYVHQELPFERLVEEMEPARDLSHHPLFQVLFAFQGQVAEGAGAEAPAGLRTTLLPNDNRTARFDLSLDLWIAEGRLRGHFTAAADLFDRTTVARMADHLGRFLEAASRDPETRIAALPLLGPAERQAVVVEWNDTAAPWPAGATLPELFFRQAARTPERVAVVLAERDNHDEGGEGDRLTYRELADRALVLAAVLRTAGVGPDDVVAVAAERSLEMVVGIYAVQTAGAAYLPLDPAHPVERSTFVLDDADVRVALVQDHLAAEAPGRALEAAGVRALPLGARSTGVGDTDADVPTPLTAPVPVPPASAAYVLYTSGSTGQPKGVVVPHRGVVNRLDWMQKTFPLDGTDRVLQKTPVTFDVSVWELFWPLLTGARLVLAAPGRHGDPAHLTDVLARSGITTLHFVPSMLQVFLDHPRLAEAPAPRRVIASGEALPPSLARRFAERLPATELHNLYGPTEASIDVTWHRCEDERGTNVPIGRPISNLAVHVLDRHGRPAPLGVPGELHLGGVGLARGYRRRPALTAGSFVPDPFSTEPGARLYRTGDLCRVRPDGEVEFLGRIDFQVKLRGLRIELGEIEAVVASHPAVRETVVVARDERLVAYVVPSHDAGLASGDLAAELRRHGGRSLPDYMVPADVVVLDTLPLSANGKVDRRALPAPDRAAGETTHVEPRGETEITLAALWEEILDLPRVGAADDFFRLGGHSLKATQVTNRVEEVFGVEVPLRTLFEAPTVAGLAARIDELALDRLDADTLVDALDEIDNLSDDELAALLAASDDVGDA